MDFEWDENKAAANLSKHGRWHLMKQKLSLKMHFMLISTIPTSLMMSDRYIIVGQSKLGRLLIVSYAEREVSIRADYCKRNNPQGETIL